MRKRWAGPAVLMSLGLLAMVAGTAAPADLAASARAGDSLPAAVGAVRARWPVVREPSGRWGVVGEVSIVAGSRAAVVEKVEWAVLDEQGRMLSHAIYDGRRALREMLTIFTHDAQGRLAVKRPGSRRVGPGDVAVAFLGAWTPKDAVPSRAEIAVSLGRSAGGTVTVPLDAFDPGIRTAWPTGFGEGPWRAVNTIGTPHHWHGGAVPIGTDVFISQRFAIDTAQVDARGRTSDPPGSAHKEDYFAWDEDILSVADGTVVAVASDRPDHEIGDGGDPTEHPAGNYVVVQHAPRLFSVYAHMRQGSAVVGIGDAVERGQAIGRVGNSGSTSEPHLHVHFADAWDAAADPILGFYRSQGVPAVFWDAHVRRGLRRLPLDGSTPREGDVVGP
jgi:Peptidase family M23